MRKIAIVLFFFLISLLIGPVFIEHWLPISHFLFGWVVSSLFNDVIFGGLLFILILLGFLFRPVFNPQWYRSSFTWSVIVFLLTWYLLCSISHNNEFSFFEAWFIHWARYADVIVFAIICCLIISAFSKKNTQKKLEEQDLGKHEAISSTDFSSLTNDVNNKKPKRKSSSKNGPISIEIKAESIYMHSTATALFYCDDPFSIKTDLEILNINKGNITSNSLITAIKAERYVIELEVMGLFQEREVDAEHTGIIQNHYGTAFFPFLSSFLRSSFFLSHPVQLVKITLPDKFRFLYFYANVFQNNNKSEVRQSYGLSDTTYIFSWDKVSDISSETTSLNFNIPVRLGGHTLFSLVKFPIIYWIIELVSIWLLSRVENPNVTFGAIVACWVFMLKSWHDAKVPRQLCLLSYLYILFGVILFIWGVLWVCCGYWTLISLIPILFILLYVLNATNHFNRVGCLPSSFTIPYVNYVIRREVNRERVAKSSNSNNE